MSPSGRWPGSRRRWAWGALLVAALLGWRRHSLVFVVSSLAIAGIILTVGLALFPFLMPSSTDPRFGLTVWDASSSRLTLWIMLLSTAFFLPIITLYKIGSASCGESGGQFD